MNIGERTRKEVCLVTAVNDDKWGLVPLLIEVEDRLPFPILLKIDSWRKPS